VIVLTGYTTVIMYDILEYGLAAVSVLLLTRYALMKRKQRNIHRKRRFWVRPLFRRRRQLGVTNLLICELIFDETGDSYNFLNYMRMNLTTYNMLLSLIEPKITSSSQFRTPIAPWDKLTVTLRYLATGMLHKSQCCIGLMYLTKALS
jgi:hypothetical protein